MFPLRGAETNTADPDAPEVTDWTGAQRGRFYRPVKQLKSLRIDADVLTYFQAQGPGYQTRINRVLRAAMVRELRRRRERGKTGEGGAAPPEVENSALPIPMHPRKPRQSGDGYSILRTTPNPQASDGERMNKSYALSALAAACLVGASTLLMAGSAQAYTGEQFASQAKVGIAQARHIALNAQPGKITDQELEKEQGGTGLRYSFDVKTGATTHEVGVDARTGKVLENSVEGPNSD